MKKFINTAKYGELYIEKVFFESYYPIVFSCVSSQGDLFLVVCSRNNKNGIKWLIARTNAKDIIQLLSDKITIRELLLKAGDKFSVDYQKGTYIINGKTTDFDENSLFLPTEDSFMEAEDGEFEEEINFYTQKQIAYNGIYRTITSLPEKEIHSNVSFVFDLDESHESSSEHCLVLEDVMKTLIDLDNISIKKCTVDEADFRKTAEFQSALGTGEDSERILIDGSSTDFEAA